MPDDSLPTSPSERQLDQLTITSWRDGDIHTIALTGEVDLANANEVDAELLRVEATDAPAIVLDLSSVTFIDSTGVRVLVFAHTRSRTDSNRLRITRPTGAVLRVMEIAGLIGVLPFEPPEA